MDDLASDIERDPIHDGLHKRKREGTSTQCRPLHLWPDRTGFDWEQREVIAVVIAFGSSVQPSQTLARKEELKLR